MRQARLARIALIGAVFGFVVNILGVFLARAFRDVPARADLFVVPFGIGNILMSVCSGAFVLVAILTRKPGLKPGTLLIAGAGAAAAGMVVWYCGLYWPFAFCVHSGGWRVKVRR